VVVGRRVVDDVERVVVVGVVVVVVVEVVVDKSIPSKFL
jgi:hypothetical protein